MSCPASDAYGPVLAPAGHPAVHQPRVAAPAGVGPDPQPLGHARPEPLDQHVGPGRQPQNDLDPVGVLEVDGDRPAAPVEHVHPGHGVGDARPVDPGDVRPQVGQHHAGERRRTDAGQLDDPDAGQRAGHQRAGALGGQDPAERDELAVGAPEEQLQLLGQQEVAVQRVVAVDAHAAVQVGGGVHDPLAAGRRPVLGHRHLAVGREPGGQPPRGLEHGEPDRLGVDVGVRRPLPDRLERGDGPAELLAAGRVLAGDADGLGGQPGHHRAGGDGGVLDRPPQRGGVGVERPEDGVGPDPHPVEHDLGLRGAGGRVLALTADAVGPRRHDEQAGGAVRRSWPAPGRRRRPARRARSSGCRRAPSRRRRAGPWWWAGSGSPSGSDSAAVSTVVPATVPGRRAACWSAVPHRATGRAPRARAARAGTGAVCRPTSSSTRHSSSTPRPAPPWSSGTAMPSSPASAMAAHRSRSNRRSSRCSSARIASGVGLVAQQLARHVDGGLLLVGQVEVHVSSPLLSASPSACPCRRRR